MPPRKKPDTKEGDSGPMVQIGLRLPRSVADAIDAHAAGIMAQHPGLEVSRSDAARALLLLGLEAAKRRRP
jgi:hypothetical protein